MKKLALGTPSGPKDWDYVYEALRRIELSSFLETDGEYTASQITNVASGPITATNVQAAIDYMADAWSNTRLAKTANYTVVAADAGSTLALGGSTYFTLTVGAASGFPANAVIVVVNEDTGRAKSIAINGLTTFKLYPLQSAIVYAQNSGWNVIRPTRWVVPGDVTFYIRTDGSDSNNDGLANSASGGFRNIQKFVDVLSSEIDINGHLVKAKLQSGATFTEQVEFAPYFGQYEATQTNPTIEGDDANPQNYIVDGTSGITFLAVNVPAPWFVRGVTLNAATGTMLESDINSMIYFANVKFGATTGAHIKALYDGKVEALSSYTIAGNADQHVIAAASGQYLIQPGNTITLSGTPVWGSSFVAGSLNGQITLTGTTFSGASTGKRWSLDDSGATVQYISAGTNQPDLIAGSTNGTYTPFPVAHGGTGGATASAARTNLGLQGQNIHGDSNYTIVAADLPLLVVSATLTAARTWTLPAANAVDAGRPFTILDTGGINGANTLTIQRGGSDNFQGVGVSANAITLAAQFNAITVVSNGVNNWFLVSLR